MMFFALLIVLTGLAWVLPWTKTGPARMRIAMALALFLVGSDPLAEPRSLPRHDAALDPAA
jgi:hypothetical protein